MLSVVVNFHNMRREAARTLYSLSAAHQRAISARDYEIIVIDNGSSEPLERESVAAHGANFAYYPIGAAEALPSPARAVNHGVGVSRGDHVGVVLDGARMASPGLLAAAMRALGLGARVLVATCAWHLGDEHQSRSMLKGYCQAVEDDLLAKLAWQQDGYVLFSRASLAQSNAAGFFGALAESCATFMRREIYAELGGFDEAFELPGGGYVNHDFFKRACDLPNCELVVLLGEGTFHQFHGGIASNVPTDDYGHRAAGEYRRVRGKDYCVQERAPIYFGSLNSHARRWALADQALK